MNIRRRADRLASVAINRGWSWIVRHGRVDAGDALARQFGYFGAGACLFFPHGTIFGERWISIGDATMVGPHASLSAGMVPGQKMVTDPVVSIGKRCMIGRGSHVVGHLSIEIGDDVFTGPYVYITDQNHSYDDPNVPIGRQWPKEAPVRIGSGSWLGTNVTVLPGAQIGEQVVIAAGSVVLGEIPDRCVIAGAPAQVVRRYEPGNGWVRPDVAAIGGDGSDLEGSRVVAEEVIADVTAVAPAI